MRLSQPVLVWQDDALRLDFPYARSLAKPRPGYIQSGLLKGIDDFERFESQKVTIGGNQFRHAVVPSKERQYARHGLDFR